MVIEKKIDDKDKKANLEFVHSHVNARHRVLLTKHYLGTYY